MVNHPRRSKVAARSADPSCQICFGTGRAPMPHSDQATQTCECVRAADVSPYVAAAAKRAAEIGKQ